MTSKFHIYQYKTLDNTIDKKKLLHNNFQKNFSFATSLVLNHFSFLQNKSNEKKGENNSYILECLVFDVA